MKHPRRALALLTAAALALTGCSSLLEQEYTYITPHNAAPTAEDDPSILRADSYQELVNALVYFISTGTEKGTVRLYMDGEDLDASLDAACLEVDQEDPLGSYAVEYITFRLSSVVTYSEATVNITYRRTKEQVSSIVQATGITAIRSELANAMSAFQPECVLRISYFNEDEEFIQDLARQAYYNAPSSALGMPQLQVYLYPDSGQQRIVEILLTYPDNLAELEQQKEALIRWLQSLSAPFATVSGDECLQQAAQAIVSAGSYDPEGDSGVCALMNQGSANSEGIALTMAALCQHLGLSFRVVEGTLNGRSHFWNMVQTSSGWRHLDLTDTQSGPYDPRTDQQMTQLGYHWDTNLMPVSGQQEETSH